MLKKINFDFTGLKKSKTLKTNARASRSVESFNFLTLIERWEEIVGPRLSKHTVPLKNSNGVLVILSNHPTFSHQLSFMEEILKKKIITIFPILNTKIKRLKFQTNPTFFEQKIKSIQKVSKAPEKEKKPKLHPQSPLYKSLKKEAEELFIDINDLDIKENFISLYIQSKCP